MDFTPFVNLTASGVLAWLVWHLVKNSIPNVLAQASKDLADTREAYLIALRESRIEHTSSLAALTARLDAHTEALTSLCAELANIKGAVLQCPGLRGEVEEWHHPPRKK